MIHLEKRISNSNSSTKYKTAAGSVICERYGVYDRISLPEGSRIAKHLKASHGFMERKEAQSYNAVINREQSYKAVASEKKTRTKVQEKIVKTAKKVKRVRKSKKSDTK